MSKIFKSMASAVLMFLLVSASGDKEEKSEKPRGEIITVAVYPIKVMGADKSLSPILSSFLVSDLGQSPTLKVVEEEMLGEVLKKLNYANSDLCDNTQCQLSVGKLTPARKILIANLSKLGEKFVIDGRVVDIEKGTVDFPFKEERVCREEDLDKLVESAAWDIREKFGEKIERPAAAAQTQTATSAQQPTQTQPQPQMPSCKGRSISQENLGKEYQLPGTKGGAMLLVAAGEFCMGCNGSMGGECDNDEQPYHQVYLDAFYIDKYEVTEGDYNGCVASKTCKASGRTYVLIGADRHPVMAVNWNDAKTYCEWAGKRLPTEAEWEKAARGTDGRIYPWGNEFDAAKAYSGITHNIATKPVGSFPSGASPYGAMDMAGNVWEWVYDKYDEGYYKVSVDRNPKGPVKGGERVLRGGGMNDAPAGLRTSFRKSDAADFRNYDYGFRCARDL